MSLLINNYKKGYECCNYWFLNTTCFLIRDFQNKRFFLNVPPSTTIPKCYPGVVFEVPALHRANIGHLTAILDTRKNKSSFLAALLKKLYSIYIIYIYVYIYIYISISLSLSLYIYIYIYMKYVYKQIYNTFTK